MRRLVRLLIQLVFGVVCFVGVTAVLIVFDGLNDVGESADAALVTGREGFSDGTGNAPGLNRAARLYKDGAFPLIIVTSDAGGDTPKFSRLMGVEGAASYLEKSGVPESAIIKDSGAKDTGEMAADVAALMQQRNLSSVMIITDYYCMSRIKLALLHAGMDNIAKSHVGHAGVRDAWPIACEVGALYGFIFHTFVMPTAEKVKQEASDAADKARGQAEKAKDNVNQKLDALPK
jgi:uncharacterized SAM-binding protein YcdF (DUF218 family)